MADVSVRLVFCCSLLFPPFAALALDPPATPVEPVTDILHRVELTDAYRWLEEPNSPRTREWLQQQAAYTAEVLAALPGQQRLGQILEPMFRTDKYSAPTEVQGRYYFTRRLAQENRESICMRQSWNAKTDEVLVRPDDVSPDPSVSLVLGDVSSNGAILMYSVRQGGEDELEVRFLDLKSRQLLPDRLPRKRYFGLALRPDGKGIYYSALGPQGTRVFYHHMGTPVENDPVVFSKGTGLLPTDSVSLSEDGRWLILGLNYGTSSRTEIRVKNLEADGPVIDVAVGVDAQFRGQVVGDHMYLGTNWNAANWRLLRVDLCKPDLQNAQVVIPERDLPLSGFTLAAGRIFARYLENVEPRIYQYEAGGKLLGRVASPGGLGSMTLPSGRWASREAFFSFSSFATPEAIYRYEVPSGRTSLWHQLKIGMDTRGMETRQVWFPSKDGTRIPMWLVHKKGLKLDGNRPVYLTGYGGFNVSRTATFTQVAALWASQDGVYALPNLRGGGEFGETWHKAAMFEKKQNTFDDFIAAAEYLIASGYTRPERIVVAGGSNGGLLVGALMTQRPDLAGAVYCGVPLLDMVRYHKFLLGRFWISEYGSADDPEQFRYLLRYSPYHNVKKGTSYPAVIFSTGDSDTRVDPLHARKMTALMQSATGSSAKPVILRSDPKSGHSRGKPVEEEVKEMVEIQAFLLHAVGVEVR